MQAFDLWAESRGIAFKRKSHRRAAFEVWKECAIELEAKEAELLAMQKQITSLGYALNELDKERDKLNGNA